MVGSELCGKGNSKQVLVTRVGGNVATPEEDDVIIYGQTVGEDSGNSEINFECNVA